MSFTTRALQSSRRRPWRPFAAVIPTSDQKIAESFAFGISSVLISLVDAGAGTESLSNAVALSLADAGAGAESFNPVVSLALTDAGAGSDSVVAPSVSILITDVGAGSEQLSALVSLLISDAGAGAESFGISAVLALLEAGTGAESFGAAVSLALTDAGLGADSPLPAQVLLGLNDTGSGLEVVNHTESVGTTDILITDIGVGSETITITVSVALADAGQALEQLEGLVALSINDVGLAIESLVAREYRPIVRIDFQASARVIEFAALAARQVQWGFSSRTVSFTFTKDTQQ